MDQSRNGKLTLNQIAKITSQEYGVNQFVLDKPTRAKTVVEARHVTFWLCRKLTDKSTTVIGRHFNRDHTTILYGFLRIEDRLPYNAEMRVRVKRILDKIGG